MIDCEETQQQRQAPTSSKLRYYYLKPLVGLGIFCVIWVFGFANTSFQTEDVAQKSSSGNETISNNQSSILQQHASDTVDSSARTSGGLVESKLEAVQSDTDSVRPSTGEEEDSSLDSESSQDETTQNFSSLESNSSSTVLVQWTFPTANTRITTSKRAMVMICMGSNACRSILVERILISIRKRGQFLGPVVLLTDCWAERYQSLTNMDPNFYTLQPLPDDWNWNFPKDMPYKRFKTYVLEYLDRMDALSSVQVLYYLDIDIVVGQPLEDWFDHVESTYLYNATQQSSLSLPSDTSKLVFFQGNYRSLPIQGGQIVMQRGLSQACLERWRYYIDSDPNQDKDQKALVALSNETQQQQLLVTQQTSSGRVVQCQFIIMPQHPHLEFMDKKSMKEIRKQTRPCPTLMHVKNTGKKISNDVQRDFYTWLLDLTPDQAHTMGKVKIKPKTRWSAEQQAAASNPEAEKHDN